VDKKTFTASLNKQLWCLMPSGAEKSLKTDFVTVLSSKQPNRDLKKQKIKIEIFNQKKK